MNLLPSMSRFSAAAALAFMLAATGCAAMHEHQSEPEPACRPGEARSIHDLMYFGTSRASGIVSAEEWSAFLRTSVTPRFPSGLTVWEASGQWRDADGAMVREGSYVLSVVHPDDQTSEAAVRAIGAEYKARFAQEAVLRVRSVACASF